MNNQEKSCPHCKTRLSSTGSAFEIVRRGISSADTPAGLPVTLVTCPKCGYIELYNLRVTASLV